MSDYFAGGMSDHVWYEDPKLFASARANLITSTTQCVVYTWSSMITNITGRIVPVATKIMLNYKIIALTELKYSCDFGSQSSKHSGGVFKKKIVLLRCFFMSASI